MSGAPAIDGQGSVSYRKLWRWGRIVTAGAGPAYPLNLAVTLLLQTLIQYNVQLLAALIGTLSTGERGEPEGIGLLVPHRVGVAASLFVALALLAIGLAFVDRSLTTYTDARMTGRLQQRLHDHLLTLGPNYHRLHDASETTMVVTGVATGAQMILRDFVSAPITRGVGLVTAMVLLAGNLQALSASASSSALPTWLFVPLIATIVLLPVLGHRLVRRAGASAVQSRQASLDLASEFASSAHAPNPRRNQSAYRTRVLRRSLCLR